VFSAGGGGKTKERRMKIAVKNEKLNEERKKLGEKRKQEGATKKEGEPEQNFVSMDGVHPSRRARVGQ
jgi:nucleolar protein 6